MGSIALEKGKQLCIFEPLPVPTTHRGISVNFILSISAVARIILCKRASSNLQQCTRLQQCPNGRGILHLESRLVALPQSVILSIPGRRGHAHVQSIPDPSISLHLLVLRVILSHIIDYDVPSFSGGLGLTDEYKVGAAHEFCFFLLPLTLQDLR